MLIALVVFAITFLIWFRVVDQYFWLFVPFFVGSAITALNTFLVLLVCTKQRPKVLFAAQYDKENAFAEGSIISTSITTGVIALYLLTLLFVVPALQSLYFDSFAEKDNIKNFLFNTVAFALGTCVASVFYRDIGGNFGKGVACGSVMVDR